MTDLDITEETVRTKLQELILVKLMDEMNLHLLKETANELCKPLSIIMNKSSNMKQLPS